MLRMRSRLMFLSALAAGVVTLVAMAGVWTARARAIKIKSTLDQARAAMQEHRFASTAEQLSRLTVEFPNEGEAWRLLGECQLWRGRRADAINAWLRIKQDSDAYPAASEHLATEWINAGQYALAEARLLEAVPAAARASDRYPLDRAIARLYRFEGRLEDLRSHLEQSWSRSPNRIDGLRELWLLEYSPQPMEAWKGALEKADQNDDRVWLGYANHAILSGQFATAAAWLDRCHAQRPDDPVVWRARLELAIATDNLSLGLLSTERLNAHSLSSRKVQSVRAWLARLTGDRSVEHREVSELLRLDPGNTLALERLAELELAAGHSPEVDKLRHRKAKLDDARDQFRKALLGASTSLMIERSGQLGKLAQEMGRSFDALAWTYLHNEASGASPGVFHWDEHPETTPNDAKLATRLDDLRKLLNERIASSGATASQSNTPTPRDPPTIPLFVNDASTAGLHFVFDNGQTSRRLLPETMSGGVALIDYDGDGWLDVYCVQGGSIIDAPQSSASKNTGRGDRLFHNKADGSFEDATERSGIASLTREHHYGMGVAVGDFDNDGHPDLFLTRLTSYALYRNRGDGTFEDATLRAGLHGRRDYPSSAAFADLDNDGDLDLYVCHYMLWDPEHSKLCKNEKGDYYYCDPSKVEPAPDHCFRNDNGRFVDVTSTSGLLEHAGRGLGVVAADLDDDGRIDLYVANDGTANNLFRNKGGFQFDELALEAGVAGSASGGYQAGMGVACGDIDGDARPDLLVTNFYGEGTTLYQNLGQGLFADRSNYSGIGVASRYLLGFGIGLADTTNQGRLDVVITNGHVNDNRPYFPYAMPSRIYQNQGDGRLSDRSAQAGAPWAEPHLGRGLATGDLDNDGRIDTVIITQNAPLVYLHNQTPGIALDFQDRKSAPRVPGVDTPPPEARALDLTLSDVQNRNPNNQTQPRLHWVTIKLEGSKSNRDGVGARVTITAGGRKQVAQRLGGGSYQSANDPRLHFGLGRNERLEHVEVQWPSGQVDHWNDLPGDRFYQLREKDSTVHQKPAMRRR
jgi:tetratricopeptide (TPR) repeat protein